MNVTPYQQEQPHTCAVACLRMAAEYFGVAHTEAELIPLCGTTLDGAEHKQPRSAFFAHWENAFHIAILLSRS